MAHATQHSAVFTCKRRLTERAKLNYSTTAAQTLSDTRTVCQKQNAVPKVNIPRFNHVPEKQNRSRKVQTPTRKSDGMASPATVFQRAIGRCRIARYPISTPNAAAAANDTCQRTATTTRVMHTLVFGNLEIAAFDLPIERRGLAASWKLRYLRYEYRLRDVSLSSRSTPKL